MQHKANKRYEIAGKPYYLSKKSRLSVANRSKAVCPLKTTVTLIEEILAGLSWAG